MSDCGWPNSEVDVFGAVGSDVYKAVTWLGIHQAIYDKQSIVTHDAPYFLNFHVGKDSKGNMPPPKAL